MRRCMLLLLWALLVLYPNPYSLYVSAQRAWSPPIDTSAVAELARKLPNDPGAIEAAVRTRIVAYAVPWETYALPWYFPSVGEVLAQGQGDCEAQAIVFASILRAKGIPARIVGSFDHMWVEYPRKRPNAAENAAVAIATQRPDGSYQFHWPKLVDWQKSWAIERAYFWDPMPTGRRWLLGAGWLVIALWGRAKRWRLGWRWPELGRSHRQTGPAGK